LGRLEAFQETNGCETRRMGIPERRITPLAAILSCCRLCFLRLNAAGVGPDFAIGRLRMMMSADTAQS
jgi:hypothetical protein